MAEIDESQRRIAAALSRIDTSFDALIVQLSAPDTSALEALESALDAEKQARHDLEGQLQALKTRHAAELETARAAISDEAVTAIDVELQNVKAAMQQLRESHQALREAQAAAVTEPEMINDALRVELEALHAERAAEIAETTAILSALEPMLAGQKESV